MATATSERVQKHRTALREAGLRPVQIWYPTRAARGLRRSAAASPCYWRKDAQEHDTTDWLAAAADTEGWQ